MNSTLRRTTRQPNRLLRRFGLAVVLFHQLSTSTHQPVHAATVEWIGASGDWNTPANWSSAPNLPGPEDDVVIDVPDLVTVIHSSGNHSVKSVLCQEAFTLSGGPLVVPSTTQRNGGGMKPSRFRA